METNGILSTLEVKDIVEAISILITFLLGILSTIISASNSKKLKEMESYKHTIKMKELEIDTRYKNNQLVIEEVYMLLINIKNISCNSECYLFRTLEEKLQKYGEVVVEARESLIWVQKRVNILSVYMNKSIYSDIGELFELVRCLLNRLDAKSQKKFFDDYWKETIQKIEAKGIDIIQEIQRDNEQIIEK